MELGELMPCDKIGESNFGDTASFAGNGRTFFGTLGMSIV